MALETGGTRGVKTWYGPQDLSQSENLSVRTAGNIREGAVTVTGSDYTSVDFTLPKGASIVGNVQIEVIEAFVLGGTTPTIAVGVDTSETTNFLCEVSEANAEAIGSYSDVSEGTLAPNAPLAAAASIAVALGGTTPTITSAGKMVVHFRYAVDNR